MKNNKILIGVLCICGIVISIASLIYYAVYNIFERIYNSDFILTFVAIGSFVLFLASITTNKNKFTKILGLIVSSISVVINFVLTISKYESLIAASYNPKVAQNLVHVYLYFALAILMLIASIFSLIYNINSFKNKSGILYTASSFTHLGLTLAYFVSYLVFTIYYGVTKNDLARVDVLLNILIYAISALLPYLCLKLSEKE